ncbi:MAG: 5'-methylthioadenosine/adenosylhomocysteine nucleosidase [Alphaproteobacteria bacterium]|nr:5'-methylthioadenosine/adenosylhomocysteine nucleosidase [Alphaproteobacteria bacterium]
MKIAFIVAMKSEFDLVAKILTDVQVKKIKHLEFIEGTYNNHDIILMQSGMAKVNAAAATVELINNFAPDKIVNTGLAGGIDKVLSVMDVVVGERICYHDVWCGEGEYGQVQGLPSFYTTDASLIQKAHTLTGETKVHFGLIASGDQFITNPEELKKIKTQFPQALAVDMESAAIAQICYLYNVPFMSLRIISDTPGIENHYNQYLDFWNKAPERSLEIIKQLLS